MEGCSDVTEVLFGVLVADKRIVVELSTENVEVNFDITEVLVVRSVAEENVRGAGEDVEGEDVVIKGEVTGVVLVVGLGRIVLP